MPIAAIYGPDDFDQSGRQLRTVTPGSGPARSGAGVDDLPIPSLEWTPEVRQVVFNAGDPVRHARDARMAFRHHVREFVLSLRHAHEPLSTVLQRTRSLLELLETQGAVHSDSGWLEAEVLEWAIEEYENAA